MARETASNKASPRQVNLIAGVEGVTVERSYDAENLPFWYGINANDAPECLKFWIGRKTVIVPLRNVLLFEMET
jgi:hypothetical protein